MTKFTSNSLEDVLTTDQVKAEQEFTKWFKSTNDGSPFVLSGFAGSGKTFLAMRFLRIVEASNLCWTVVAPTHKAVGVLKQALDNESLNPTWYPSTIHRLLRLKLKRKGDVELCERTDQTANALEQIGLVLIDEASMVDSILLEITLQCAHQFMTRLVFVGDPAQLPPVNEPISPVFSIKRAHKVSLEKVMRHQGPVLRLANSVRDQTLPCCAPPCIPLIKTKQGVVGCIDQESWLKRAQDALRSASLKDSPDEARILCYTNRSLERLIPHARRAIHGAMADQLPVLPGEVLITRTAVMAPASCNGEQVGEEPDMLLGSNRELIVQDVTPERCDLSIFGLNTESDLEVPIINTQLVQAKVGELDLSLRVLPTAGTEARHLFDSTLKRLRGKAKEAEKKESRSLWRKFFAIRDAFASLSPAAVLTVHRSQGSTFGEVFVASDVFWPSDLTLRRQLFYVAVSRARSGVWIVGKSQVNSNNKAWQTHFLKS